jgi:hypothetical protein
VKSITIIRDCDDHNNAVPNNQPRHLLFDNVGAPPFRRHGHVLDVEVRRRRNVVSLCTKAAIVSGATLPVATVQGLRSTDVTSQYSMRCTCKWGQRLNSVTPSSTKSITRFYMSTNRFHLTCDRYHFHTSSTSIQSTYYFDVPTFLKHNVKHINTQHLEKLNIHTLQNRHVTQGHPNVHIYTTHKYKQHKLLRLDNDSIYLYVSHNGLSMYTRPTWQLHHTSWVPSNSMNTVCARSGWMEENRSTFRARARGVIDCVRE